MSKSVPTAIMDLVLDAIAASTLMSVVSDTTTPTALTNSLANATMASGDFAKDTGDAGAGSRKLTMTAKSGQTVDTTGSPKHVVLSLSTTLKLVTTCSGPDLTSGSTVDFPTWDYELGIPS